MIEVWEKIKMRPDEELPWQLTESDEIIASTALLALVRGDEEEEEDTIEQVLVLQQWLRYSSPLKNIYSLIII